MTIFIREIVILGCLNVKLQVEIPGFDDKEATVYCGNVAGDLLVQVCRVCFQDSVRFFSLSCSVFLYRLQWLWV